jgi:ubiquinone/menaquinone biosynthesis C-methylase UbiE
LRDDIVAHYEAGAEKLRLGSWARLEYIRNIELLERYMPNPPTQVGDVGGGPGTYAVPLAAQGHTVHLLDPIALHIEQARLAAPVESSPTLASAEVGDARELPWGDGEMDVVIFFGPLYHLTMIEGRRTALSEAKRVLRQGGLLFAMAISRFVSLHDGLTKRFLVDPEFRSIMERDIEVGQHRNRDRDPRWFTTAYFHRPEEFEHEISCAGFEIDALLAVEGPAGRLDNLSWWLEDAERQEILLKTIRRVESERSLLGASPQILAVARK